MRKNPSPNPNPRLASDSLRGKDRIRGTPASSPFPDRVDREAQEPTTAASDDSSSLNRHRKVSRKHQPYSGKSAGIGSGFDSTYVTLDVGSCTGKELRDLKRRLISELEQVRSLIKSAELQPSRSTCLSTSGYGGGNGGGREVTSAAAGESNSSPQRYKRSLPLVSPREAKRQFTGGDSDKISASMAKKCVQILTKLMKHRFGWVFNAPVDVTGLGLHDYYQIVKCPMDLGTVKSKLDKSFYASPLEFAADVRLTFSNALLYNPVGHDVHKMAEQLLKLFEKLFADACKAPYEKQGQSYHGGKGEEEVERKQSHSLSGAPGHLAQSREDASTGRQSLPPANSTTPRAPSPPPELPAQPQPPALALGKQPKPKAKDPNKREMSFEEKKKLSLGLQSLPQEKMAQVLQIVQRRNPDPALHGDEIELDFEVLDTETLWELDRFVGNCKKMMSKIKRQEAMSTAAPATSGGVNWETATSSVADKVMRPVISYILPNLPSSTFPWAQRAHLPTICNPRRILRRRRRLRNPARKWSRRPAKLARKTWTSARKCLRPTSLRWRSTRTTTATAANRAAAPVVRAATRHRLVVRMSARMALMFQ